MWLQLGWSPQAVFAVQLNCSLSPTLSAQTAFTFSRETHAFLESCFHPEGCLTMVSQTWKCCYFWRSLRWSAQPETTSSQPAEAGSPGMLNKRGTMLGSFIPGSMDLCFLVTRFLDKHWRQYPNWVHQHALLNCDMENGRFFGHFKWSIWTHFSLPLLVGFVKIGSKASNEENRLSHYPFWEQLAQSILFISKLSSHSSPVFWTSSAFSITNEMYEYRLYFPSPIQKLESFFFPSGEHTTKIDCN